MKLIEFIDVSLKINNNIILDKISLTLNKQEITTLVGVNGGGKTSLARLIIGALKPSSGKIIYKNNPKINYLPQKVNIDNTIIIDGLSFLKLFNSNIEKNPNFYLWTERLKINNLLASPINKLSLGQLQKLLLIQAVCSDIDVLILDEPTQYMDFLAINEFYKILNEIRNQNKCAILLISHDLHLVMQHTDMVYCINKHICCHGKAEDINLHPEFLKLVDVNNKNLSVSFYAHHHDHQHQ